MLRLRLNTELSVAWALLKTSRSVPCKRWAQATDLRGLMLNGFLFKELVA
jgi:hypothetical protein